MKKILFILPNLNGGGAERVTVNYLRSINFDKYYVMLIVFGGENDLADLLPAEVNIINLKTGGTKNSAFPLLRAIRSYKPNIVYTTHSRVAVLLLIIKLFSPKFKHIARMQNTPSLELKYGEYGKGHRWLYSQGFRSADVVIAQTEMMLQDAIKCFNVEPSKLKVLHNPIDKEYISTKILNTVSPFPINELTVIASGRIRKEKGFDLVIKALPSVVDKYSNLVLHIIGNDKGEKENLMQLVSDLQMTSHVVFHGYIKNPYLFYFHCDIFVLASRWEGFPNALLENYFLNTPLVAAKCVPVIEQLVIEGVNGFLCEVEDELCLADKILQCVDLKREHIKNIEYINSSLEAIFE